MKLSKTGRGTVCAAPRFLRVSVHEPNRDPPQAAPWNRDAAFGRPPGFVRMSSPVFWLVRFSAHIQAPAFPAMPSRGSSPMAAVPAPTENSAHYSSGYCIGISPNFLPAPGRRRTRWSIVAEAGAGLCRRLPAAGENPCPPRRKGSRSRSLCPYLIWFAGECQQDTKKSSCISVSVPKNNITRAPVMPPALPAPRRLIGRRRDTVPRSGARRSAGHRSGTAPGTRCTTRR